MLWEPTVSDDVLKVAVPLASETAPSDVVPSIKLTLPVGVPAPGDWAETVAVTVTDCPNADGLAEEAMLVVVAAWVMFCCRLVVVVVPLKFVSPS